MIRYIVDSKVNKRCLLRGSRRARAAARSLKPKHQHVGPRGIGVQPPCGQRVRFRLLVVAVEEVGPPSAYVGRGGFLATERRRVVAARRDRGVW